MGWYNLKARRAVSARSAPLHLDWNAGHRRRAPCELPLRPTPTSGTADSDGRRRSSRSLTAGSPTPCRDGRPRVRERHPNGWGRHPNDYVPARSPSASTASRSPSAARSRDGRGVRRRRPHPACPTVAGHRSARRRRGHHSATGCTSRQAPTRSDSQPCCSASRLACDDGSPRRQSARHPTRRAPRHPAARHNRAPSGATR